MAMCCVDLSAVFVEVGKCVHSCAFVYGCIYAICIRVRSERGGHFFPSGLSGASKPSVLGICSAGGMLASTVGMTHGSDEPLSSVMHPLRQARHEDGRSGKSAILSVDQGARVILWEFRRSC